NLDPFDRHAENAVRWFDKLTTGKLAAGGFSAAVQLPAYLRLVEPGFFTAEPLRARRKIALNSSYRRKRHQDVGGRLRRLWSPSVHLSLRSQRLLRKSSFTRRPSSRA